MAAFCHPHSRRAGRWRGKIPGMPLRQCPALLPGEENPWNPEAPAVPVWNASPWQSRFYRAGNAKWYRRGIFYPLGGSFIKHATGGSYIIFPASERGTPRKPIFESDTEDATNALEISSAGHSHPWY